MDRQTDCRKMALDALGLRSREQPAFGGEGKRQCHPERNRLAVQKPVGKAGCGLERVAEGMAEIEQRPLAALALVTRDDGGLHATAHRDGVLARGTACEQLPPVRLQPGEEAGIPEQAIFDDFGIASAELPRRQRVEQRGIG